MRYPKIQTLFNRNAETFGVISDELRCPEFALIERWLITEKIDGTNVRVMLFPDGHVEYRGRTDKAQFHPSLMAYLERAFPPENLQSTFAPDDMVVVYGEGYGPKIQSGGKYRSNIALRIFDVKVNDEWWLDWDDVCDVANSLGVLAVPFLGFMSGRGLPKSMDDLGMWVETSQVARQENQSSIRAEGIVARTDPLLFDRRGNRVMWKLKFKDFK